MTGATAGALHSRGSRPCITPQMWYAGRMVRSLEQAIAQLENLPAGDQEHIGRQLLSHVAKLRQLREEIDKGICSLDAGEGRPLDIDEFLTERHARYGEET